LVGLSIKLWHQAGFFVNDADAIYLEVMLT